MSSPLALLRARRFGEDALSGHGYWVWILAAAAMVLLTAQWARNPPWALLLRVGGSGLGGLVRRPAAARTEGPSHLGLPALRGLVARIGVAEKIPTQLFYAPLALQWLWLAIRFRSLSLPTLVNPMIEVGGLWGESKQVYLDMVTGENRRWLARGAPRPRPKAAARWPWPRRRGWAFRWSQSRTSAGRAMASARWPMPRTCAPMWQPSPKPPP